MNKKTATERLKTRRKKCCSQREKKSLGEKDEVKGKKKMKKTSSS